MGNYWLNKCGIGDLPIHFRWKVRSSGSAAGMSAMSAVVLFYSIGNDPTEHKLPNMEFTSWEQLVAALQATEANG